MEHRGDGYFILDMSTKRNRENRILMIDQHRYIVEVRVGDLRMCFLPPIPSLWAALRQTDPSPLGKQQQQQ